MYLYVVDRESGDGLETDIFEDRELAEKWAKHIGGQFREEHTIDQETLVAMMDEDKSVYAREEWDDLGLEEEES